jgi:DNA-binding MarR family transcriptional regulator
VIKQATLYSSLKRLEKLGWIHSYWGDVSGGARRRYFSLTDTGKDYLTKNQAEYEFSRTVLDQLLSDKAFDLSTDAPFETKDMRPYTPRQPKGTAAVAATAAAASLAHEEVVRAELDFVEEDYTAATAAVQEDDGNDLVDLPLTETAPDGECEEEMRYPASNMLEQFRSMNAERLEKKQEEKKKEEVKPENKRYVPHVRQDEDFISARERAEALVASSQAFDDSDVDYEARRERAAAALGIGKYREKPFTDEHTYKPVEIDLTGEQRYAPQPEGEKKDSVEVLGIRETHTEKKIEKLGSLGESSNYKDVFNQILAKNNSQDSLKPVTNDTNYINYIDLSSLVPTVKNVDETKKNCYEGSTSITVYNRNNTSHFYAKNYIFSNKIALHASYLTFLIYVLLISSTALIFNIIMNLDISMYVYPVAALIGIVYPAAAHIIYASNPNKRTRAERDYKSNVFRGFFVSVSAAGVVSVGGILFLNTDTLAQIAVNIVLPIVAVFTFFFYHLCYNALFRTKKYHLN